MEKKRLLGLKAVLFFMSYSVALAGSKISKKDQKNVIELYKFPLEMNLKGYKNTDSKELLHRFEPLTPDQLKNIIKALEKDLEKLQIVNRKILVDTVHLNKVLLERDRLYVDVIDTIESTGSKTDRITLLVIGCISLATGYGLGCHYFSN